MQLLFMQLIVRSYGSQKSSKNPQPKIQQKLPKNPWQKSAMINKTLTQKS